MSNSIESHMYTLICIVIRIWNDLYWGELLVIQHNPWQIHHLCRPCNKPTHSTTIQVARVTYWHRQTDRQKIQRENTNRCVSNVAPRIHCVMFSGSMTMIASTVVIFKLHNQSNHIITHFVTIRAATSDFFSSLINRSITFLIKLLFVRSVIRWKCQ